MTDFKSQYSIEDSLILTSFDLVNFLTKNSEAMVRESGLSVQQWLVLLQIVNDSNFPQPGSGSSSSCSGVLASDIAQARGVSRPNISALVAALLKKGMVEQRQDPQDRRCKSLHITEKGLQTLERIEPLRRQVNAELFEEFSTEELEAAHAFLLRWLEKLWHHEGPGET